ncbi:MAG: hypothetical protein ACQETB_02045 [Halobacteriota archaeon]
MDWQRVRKRVPGRVFGGIVGTTLLLTAALVGVVALLAGDTAGASGRIPYYVLATAIAFVVSLWKLEESDEAVDGITVLIASTGIAIGCGILFSLAVEGIRFGVSNPGRIVASQLLVYFVAAGLVCTSLGMWSLRHWREFTAHENST